VKTLARVDSPPGNGIGNGNGSTETAAGGGMGASVGGMGGTGGVGDQSGVHWNAKAEDKQRQQYAF
jgi:hypothetical protein